MNKQEREDFNKQIIFDKFSQLKGELNYFLDQSLKDFILRTANSEYTHEELKLLTKSRFISDIGRRLIELL